MSGESYTRVVRPVDRSDVLALSERVTELESRLDALCEGCKEMAETVCHLSAAIQKLTGEAQ